MVSVLRIIISLVVFAALPASTNYKLNNYGFGTGGAASMSSPSYKANAITGEQSGSEASTNYKTVSGNNGTQQANVPGAPTFTNPSNYYDKLKFILDNGNNPTDATFLIAISPDNFTTTYYVHPDDTISTSFTTADYQTYAAWGGASGQLVIGLLPSTTYTMKVRASTGAFTESAFGPTATATTSAPTLTFDVYINSTSTDPHTPPYTLSLGNLTAGSVITGSPSTWASVDTNADYGVNVYIGSANTGLKSNLTSHTIASSTADLAVASEGEGVQDASVTQTSGGPLSMVSPFNGATQNVGITKAQLQVLFTATAPITAGIGEFKLKAKASTTTPAANDYADTLTVVAAATF